MFLRILPACKTETKPEWLCFTLVLFFSSFCLPEQSNDHWCREGETAGENLMSTYTNGVHSYFCCPVRKKPPNKTKTLSASVSHGVSASHTSSFPAAGGWGSPSDDLMRPLLISISQLACCSAWLKTREGITHFFFFFFFPSDYQKGKLSGSHRQRCKWMLVIQKRY